MATSRDVLNSLEVHPVPNFDIFQLAETMISLATVTGIPVAYVDGKVVANSRTTLEQLIGALRGPRGQAPSDPQVIDAELEPQLPFTPPALECGDDDDDDD